MKLISIVPYLGVFLFIVDFGESSYASVYKETLDPDRRIIGGQLAEKGQFPYQVSVLYRRRHICGGSLFTVTRVLTAAHCKVGPTANYAVLLGAINLIHDYDGIQKRKARKFYLHPDFPVHRSGIAPNDIGFITLAKPVQLTPTVRIIPLPTTEECDAIEEVTISGWGYVSAQTISIKLRWAILTRLTHSHCKKNLIKVLHSANMLRTSMICSYAFYSNPISACAGDSGGPVVLNGTLVGAISWGISPCGVEDGPTVATRICNFREFVEDPSPSYPDTFSNSYSISVNYSIVTACIVYILCSQ